MSEGNIELSQTIQITNILGATTNHPSYKTPVLAISGIDKIEVGAVLSPYTVNSTIQQNDASALDDIEIQIDGNTTTTPELDASRMEAGDTIEVKGILNYEAPAPKNNNYNQPDTTNAFPAGVAEDSYLVDVLYSIFFGSTTQTPSTSAEVRALSNTFLQNPTLETGTTDQVFCIALPPNKTLNSVLDLDASNANYTADFEETQITVEDAGGTNRIYTLYTLVQDAPFGSSHTLQITIN